MRRVFLAVITLLLCGFAVPAAVAAPAGHARAETVLATGWKFHLGDVAGAADADFDDSSWTPVSLPHTWNAADGADGGGNYRRDVGWYRTRLAVPPGGRRVFLQFDGANLVTDVYVGGRHAGRHEGGYSGFRFDITDLAPAGRPVPVAVAVDNRKNPDVAPLDGDFTLFGGLYRDVRLVVTDPVHVDALDYGGPGVFVRQKALTDAVADVDVTTRVTNDTAVPRRIPVRTVVRDAARRVVAVSATVVTVGAGRTVPVVSPVRVLRPHRWNGVRDPYLYSVTAEAGGDAVTVPLGLRTVAVDPERGFFLNGVPYPLHGVNTQLPSRPDRGAAVTAADIDADYALIAELGANAVRMAHYQHSPREYELADRLGLVVWTEVPLVGFVTASDAFTANASAQAHELVRQNANHPSVVMWGLGNEQYVSSPAANAVLDTVQKVFRADDPDRLTTYAHCCLSDTDPLAGHADLTGYNRYYGWYVPGAANLGPWADGVHRAEPGRRIAVSEYGAGASVRQHEQHPAPPVPGGHWHPEEYQAEVAEAAWRAIEARPYLWGSFVWVMFDFASDGRNEGDRPGINDKGLVTDDRVTRKDAFYWYQANWSSRPVLHITSARDTVRTTAATDVKVYAGSGPVSLTVNGVPLGTRVPDDHIAVWSGVPLQPGPNVVQATSLTDGRTDTVTWTRQP
ncbi:glycoside hydrolase family 2 TIM barrel-domain containing protein [Amycolatopsis sp. NEAU-NG30]|uniref:Glycoside hydrolase family 2 TIM barrel-domain containing protein n=1 Tax=Amycolatopsis melonis TaxID=3156488 RepID=A0ABV0LCU1_9PSEU